MSDDLNRVQVQEVLDGRADKAKQVRWAIEYVNSNMDVSEASARVGMYQGQSNRLLALPHVQKAIADELEKAARAAQMSVRGVLEEIRRLAFLDPRMLLDMRAQIGGVDNPRYGKTLPMHEWPSELAACISSFEFNPLTGELAKVKFWSKVDALTILAKHFKILIDQRHITVDGELTVRMEDMTPDQLDARVRQVQRGLIDKYGAIDAQPLPLPLEKALPSD
jgi:phage terminase small subunit